MEFDNSRHSILNSIKNGEYFNEAREWYFIKYTHVKTQRFYWLAIVLMVCSATYIAINTSILNYATKSYPFPIYFKDTVKKFPQIKPLSIQEFNLNEEIANHLLAYYVVTREKYNPMKIDKISWNKHTQKIANLSSKRVFNQYQEWVEPDLNPNSPIMIYQTNAERTINIDKVVFIGEKTLPDKAQVFFTALVTDRNNNAEKTKWVADISFSISDMKDVVQDPSSLQFVITAYSNHRVL